MDASSSSSSAMAIEMGSDDESVAKMVSLCKRMKEGVEDVGGTLVEVGSVLKASPDAAALVIETVSKLLIPRRRSGKMQCIILLGNMQGVVGPTVSPESREKALRLAVDLKEKLPVNNARCRHHYYYLDVVVFLELIVLYRLVSIFNRDVDLLEMLSLVTWYRNARKLLKKLGLSENIPILIDKMSRRKMKQMEAVRYAHIYNLADIFPPVPLLLAYVKDLKEALEERRKKGDVSSCWVVSVELDALKAVLKTVEEYKIVGFPRESFEERIDQLEKEKLMLSNKRGRSAEALNPDDEQRNKRSLTALLGESFQSLRLEEKNPL